MKEQTIARLMAVINTLNGVMIRADQIDAIQRISACVNELTNVIADEKEESSEPAKP